MFIGKREPLDTSAIPLQLLKAAEVKHSSTLIALALCKSCNAADVAFKARPTGVAEQFTLYVATSSKV
ncbi:hypothetical protein [Microbulbifer sp. TRSA007]|uniref:hypothetical protein n=1 Tax=Microbulbifer sp. TRSA007 TaxID=3243384 RepID=UPI00403A13D3